MKKRKKHPWCEMTGGYLKELDVSELKENRQSWWNELSGDDKTIIKSIPNFDPDIFYECTGIKLE